MRKFYHYLGSALLAAFSIGVQAQNCATISTFPFSESFEDGNATRDCWSQIVESGTAGSDTWRFEKGSYGGLDFNVRTAHSGELNARLEPWVYSDDTVVKLVTPKLNTTSLSSPTLSFYFSEEAWGANQNELKVYYRLSESTNWILLKHFWSNVVSWRQEVITLPESSPEMQIAFEGINHFGKYIVLDDVTVSNAADVPANTASCTPSTPSNNFEGGRGDLGDIYIANDFSVSAFTQMTVDQVKFNILQKEGINNFSIYFYSSDDYNFPAASLGKYENIQPSKIVDLHERNGYTFKEVTFDLPQSLVIRSGAQGGRYWIGLKVENENPATPSYWETTSILDSGLPDFYSSDGVNWSPTGSDVDFDGVFTLIGNCQPTDPTEDYCIPRFTIAVQPISYVKFNEIDNRSGITDLEYEPFRDMKANVTPGQTIPITIEGDTGGDWSSFATAFIDWNKNGKMDDDGESYPLGSITNSTGEDGEQLISSITVPQNALIGENILRIVMAEIEPTNPCAALYLGQAEDYTIVVNEKLAVSDLDQSKKLMVYPNPASDKIFIKTTKDIETVELFNYAGQKLKSYRGNQLEFKINDLTTGLYLLQVRFKDGSLASEKVIKK